MSNHSFTLTILGSWINYNVVVGGECRGEDSLEVIFFFVVFVQVVILVRGIVTIFYRIVVVETYYRILACVLCI